MKFDYIYVFFIILQFEKIKLGFVLGLENSNGDNFLDNLDYYKNDYGKLYEENQSAIIEQIDKLFGENAFVSNISLQIFVNNSAPIFIIDLIDGQIVLSNLEASQFYKYSIEELNNLKIYDLLANKDNELNDEIKQSIKFHRNFIKVEHKTKDNKIRNVEFYPTPFKINNKEYFLAIIIDRTDDNYLEQELIKNNNELTKANSELSGKLIGYQSNNNRLIESARYMTELMSKKDRLFSILSHDIKNYIQTILNISNGLISEAVIENYDPYLISQLNNLHISTDYLHKLLVNLLDWSKVQTGKMNIVINDYLLKDIVESNFQLFKLQAESKKIKLVNEIDDDLMVKTDINIINTILRNLLSNSIKFSNIKKTIKIFSEPLTHTSLLIHIEDEGIGISDDLKKKLFNIRYQVNTLGTFGESGSGIGLLLIKELIDGIGERIWFDSELGLGTKFHFTLRKV